MKRIHLAACLLAIGPGAAVAYPEPPLIPPAQVSPFESLVAAERAFSALSVERGMKEAFVTYLADDGIIFRPGPVLGRRIWRARPNPSGTLIWEPDFAEISGAGDLGVTSGPWEYRPAPERGTEIAHGHFVSVWKRMSDSTWRVAADGGIDHPKPEHGLGEVMLERGPEHPRPREIRDFGGLGYGFGLMSGSGIGFGLATGPGYVPRADRMRAGAINAMMTAERDITFRARTKGVAQAYAAHAAADVRLYREGAIPTAGVTEATLVVAKRPKRAELLPLGDGMASSCDLGYSYGLITWREAGASQPDTSAYLHVWRKDDAGRWKLAVDAERAYP